MMTITKTDGTVATCDWHRYQEFKVGDPVEDSPTSSVWHTPTIAFYFITDSGEERCIGHLPKEDVTSIEVGGQVMTMTNQNRDSSRISGLPKMHPLDLYVMKAKHLGFGIWEDKSGKKYFGTSSVPPVTKEVY